MFHRLAALTRRGLSLDRDLVRQPAQLLPRLGELSLDALIALSPFLLALLVASLLAPFLLNAWVFSPKALMPSFSRMDPLKGVGRIISWQGFVEMVKAVGKALIVGGVAAWALWRELDGIVGLQGEAMEAGFAHSGHIVAFCFLVIVAAMALIVAVDVPFQLWQYYDKLKMTKEEVRQEHKQMEGDPQIKGRIRMLQRESARRRMMSAVPTANVVVTNPTHFSVALAYQAGMQAPKVVAKGRGEIALKIRQIAAENRVPTLEAPPLARALYRWAEVDDEIPNRLYAAVAEVLAYIYQLDAFHKAGGTMPLPPRDLPVPAELDPGVALG
jgi:flagellar biosynthetic protein FlhB